ncbi:MAG: cobalamin-dependent protein, partial [Muribaculaceae bacterium]|nr:cobalamin-dependent protein [Muribaculaceae bacterium]
IGKNIVSVIMNCNGFRVIDLGVMVPAEDIIDRAVNENASFIGLSGLITPSLEEMCHVARLMESRGLTIPLLIGGATTSELHTAVKIAPCYSGPVVYTRDAAMLPGVAHNLSDTNTRSEFIAALRERQTKLRHEYNASSVPLLPIDEARIRRFQSDAIRVTIPLHTGITDLHIPVDEAATRINWRAFFDVWKLDARFAELATITGCDHCQAQWLAATPQAERAKASEAMQLLKEARRTIARIASLIPEGIPARVAILPAAADSQDNILITSGINTITLPTLRQQTSSNDTCISLADYIAPADESGIMTDHIGVFAVTIGTVVQQLINQYKESGDDYKALLYQSVADRLCEAATSVMHSRVHTELWGNGCDRGIRPAIGYPSLPDQSLVFVIDQILDYHSLGIEPTEHGALNPTASTTGLIFPHPQARYFTVGRISHKQLADYARRRGLSTEDLTKYLTPMD